MNVLSGKREITAEKKDGKLQNAYKILSGVGDRPDSAESNIAMAQTYIQQHDGLIEVDSRPGRSDFRVLIPLP